MMQKKFLEEQLDKDVKALANQMTKTELEINKEQLIPSRTALSRL